jgi:hypothetical protein
VGKCVFPNSSVWRQRARELVAGKIADILLCGVKIGIMQTVLEVGWYSAGQFVSTEIQPFRILNAKLRRNCAHKIVAVQI